MRCESAEACRVPRNLTVIFGTPHNFTTSCPAVYARFQQTLRSLTCQWVFRHLKHCPINMLKTRVVNGNNDALLEIFLAHNCGACTNVSCFHWFDLFCIQSCRSYYDPSFLGITITLCKNRTIYSKQKYRTILL